MVQYSWADKISHIAACNIFYKVFCAHGINKNDLPLIMKKILLLVSIQLTALLCTAQMLVQQLRTENMINPFGIDAAQPRFSWQLASDKRNALQTAYEIIVTAPAISQSAIWKSGKINSDSSVMISYKGQPLQSNTTYYWQVRVWDNDKKPAAFSEKAIFKTALLHTTDWKANWIEPGFEEDTILRPSPLLRKEFTVSKKIKSATAYITAHGMYEAQINGKRIGDAYLTPGWTTYPKRLQYQTYNVTDLLTNGNNAIAVTLGSGWYRGTLGFVQNANFYGKDIALLLQVNITYTDGTTSIIATDDSWKSNTGAIQYSEIYNGETIDARLEKKGWALPNYNDINWSSVKVSNHTKNNLIATRNEPVKKQEKFKPVKIVTTPAGEKVIDFGQNLVGWVVVKVKGNKGDTITLSHAEVLDKAGNFYTENLRAAKAQNKYILAGDTQEIFEPHFTWQGFRYIKVEGFAGALNPADFEAVALYSDMEKTGSFTTDNVLINQLQHNIEWGQRGNFLDIPTDCPQRDERLGWTGDAQAFSRTATFNMNVNNFFAKWLQDVEAEQIDGVVPHVVPNVLGAGGNSAGWSDAATIVPWNIYLAFGDKQLLQRQYNSMKAYIESISKVTQQNLWATGWHFGDWLFYKPNDDLDGSAAVTDKFLIAQCFYAHSTQLVINAATVLGNVADVKKYSDLLATIKNAFSKEYVTANGRLVSGTQTAYVLALNFDMLPQAQRMQASQRLADNVAKYGNHLTTGFLGTPYICQVLTRFGFIDVAYKLLLQETYPSWLYPVKMGATTIWERWDGQKPDSTFQSTGMNSFNHYAYGAIGDWLYREVAGLDTYDDGVGYKHIKVKPHIGGNFTNVTATLKTYYGNTSAGWKIEKNSITIAVTVPPNTYATIFLPAANESDIKENGIALSAMKDIKIMDRQGEYVVVQTGAGNYNFTIAKAASEENNSKLTDYIGTYNTSGGMVKSIEIKLKDNKLNANLFGNNGGLDAVKNEKDTFTSADGSKVIFTRNKTGKVFSIKLQSLGISYEGVKQ